VVGHEPLQQRVARDVHRGDAEAAHGLQRERDGHRPGQPGQQVADARHREAHDEQHGHRQPGRPAGEQRVPDE